MTIAYDLKKYHDSVFKTVIMNWEKYLVEIKLSAWEKDVVIFCEDFKELSLTNKQEWGESRSVNTIEISKNESVLILIIEIQSGDSLKCVCGNIKILERHNSNALDGDSNPAGNLPLKQI